MRLYLSMTAVEKKPAAAGSVRCGFPWVSSPPILCPRSLIRAPTFSASNTIESMVYRDVYIAAISTFLTLRHPTTLKFDQSQLEATCWSTVHSTIIVLRTRFAHTASSSRPPVRLPVRQLRHNIPRAHISTHTLSKILLGCFVHRNTSTNI